MFKMIKRMSFVIGIILVLILGFSYGTFIYTSDSYRATEMLVSNLTYGIDITASDAKVSGKTVNVSSGDTSTVALKVTSLNKVDTKYGVDYKITKGTGTVKYASNTGWLPTGKINENNVGTYEKVVKVIIAAETDMSVNFTVTGGFPNNDLTEVTTGYTRITEKAENIISYNDTLTTVIGKETIDNLYGGESVNNYLQYPINEDNTKNIWRILGTYTGVGTKIVANQTSTTTKSTLSTDLNSFYNTLEKTDNYILTTDKFNCTNTTCTTSSYSKVGLISTSEYEMLGGINSYLASSESYFALDNGTIKNVTSSGIEETSTSSGLRPAVYLQDYLTVTGSGTVSDPFKLKMPAYVVVLNVVNGTATLPSKIITRGENATYEITPNTGYKLVLSSNTCSNGTLSGSTFTISNVTSAQSCTITLTPESYTLTLDPNGGYFGNPTEIDDGFSDAFTLAKGVSYPTYIGNTLNLTSNQKYMLSFDYWCSEGSVEFNVDLFPDSLPELHPVATTTQQTMNWIFSSSSSDMTSAQIRYFNDRTVPNSYDILIVNKHLYECNDCSITSTSNIVYSNTYGDLPTPKRPGWTFKGWYTSDGVKVDNTTTYNNVSNTTITAKWDKLYYNVTMNTPNGTTAFSPIWKWFAGWENGYVELTPDSGYTSEGATISCDGGATSSISGGRAYIRNVYQDQTCTINFKKAEYIVTLNVVNGTGSASQTVNYNTTATFTGISPNSGYSSSSPTISCTGGSFSGTTLTVSNVTSARTCTITFNKMTLSDKLLADKTTRPGARTDFSTVLTIDNTKTLYTGTEEGTTVYYFAGNATDNWVKLGGFYWRIIRTNSDGGVRLLYHGTSTTATDAYIGTSAFNSTYNDSMYVGYMYGTSGSLDSNRDNTNNSTIKGVIDTWYASNLNTNYGKYISTTAIYCNDKGTSYGPSINFPAWTRLNTNKTPTYNCSNSKDAFSGSNSEAKLTYPIALMTADEVSFAGGKFETNAPTWYYYNSANGSSTGTTYWWLLSPSHWSGYGSYVFMLYGLFTPGGLFYNEVDVSQGVRPVTSLKACVKWKSGDGSASSPYEIEETTSGC